MHAWSTSMLFVLHSAFMLSVVKMLLKGDVGGWALNSNGNYIVDHGKPWKIHVISSYYSLAGHGYFISCVF